jgi:8-oxo-dGTP pyrophosphatase MutT (NUDIX family)
MSWLEGFALDGDDVARLRAAMADGDVWTRAAPLHVTGSALVVHPASSRVLLRWHERYQMWNHVGGHADDGETDPFATALREAIEETGLRDLHPFPGPGPEIVLVEIVPVSAAKGEPDHEHADVCYLLATDSPDSTVEEHGDAALEWVTLDEARHRANPHVRHLLDRAAPVLGT